MEPPRKRQRISSSMELEALDPDDDLFKARTENDFRLKSTFESIFEKYSKDFSTVGDEIDLETGEIVVNNGHLRKMRDEQDAGKLLNMLIAAPGDHDDLGDYEAEEVERKAILAIPELEKIFADSHSKGIAHGDWPSINNDDPSSPPDSGLEGTLRLKASVDGQLPSASQQKFPSSADILRQFGTNLGPRIIQYVAQLQSGSGSKVDTVWQTPALPYAPPEEEAFIQPVQKPVPANRAASPTIQSIWGSEATKAQAKKKHLRTATEHSRKQARKSPDTLPVNDRQAAPLQPLQNGVSIYSPNTRRKLTGDADPVIVDLRATPDEVSVTLPEQEISPSHEPTEYLADSRQAIDQNTVSNIKPRRSARLRSASDVTLDVQFSKSPMKPASRRAMQRSQPSEKRTLPGEGSKGSTLRIKNSVQGTSQNQTTVSSAICTPSRKCPPAAEKGQSTPVSSLLRSRNRKKDVSISPLNSKRTHHAGKECFPSSVPLAHGENGMTKTTGPSAQSSPDTPTVPTFRKCGEMGFRCSKEFCMKCMRNESEAA